MDQVKPNPEPKGGGVAPPGAVPPKLSEPKTKPRRSGKGWLLFTIATLAFLAWILHQPTPQRPVRTFGPPPNPGVFRNRNTPTGRQGFRSNPPAKKAARVSVAGPRAAVPEFSKTSAVFTGDLSVELTVKSPQAKIRYTLDGSDPAENSPTYSGPLSIHGTTLLKAKSFEAGMAPSPTVAQTYTLLDSSLADFTSNLPLLIINTFGQQPNKQEPIFTSLRIITPRGARDSLRGDSDFDGRCHLKIRGYSSLRLPKHSFTVKIRDEDGESQKASLLGMPNGADWVLYAPYSDKTMIRDVLAYDLSNKMGHWAAHTRFVEVFINRNGGKLSRRDYAGVYVLEEKIKRGKDRVNIKKLTPEDNTEPDITGGYIIKRDHTSPPGGGEGGFNFFGQTRPSYGDGYGFMTSRGLHLFYVEPKEAEITPAQKAWLSQYFNQFESALYGPNFRSPTDGYARFLDVDSFIDQFWIVELSKNVDGFRYSCFMSKDRGGRLRLEPIWDWNLSFGNANYHQGWTPQGWYWPLIRPSEVSWFRRLRQDPDFIQRLTDRWGELRKKVLAPDTVLQQIDEYSDQLQEAQARNYQRWPILGQSVNPNWYVGDTYADEVSWMKTWIQERIAWIDSQFLPSPHLAQDKEAPAKLSFSSGGAAVYYTLDGSDPRSPGGGVSPNAHEYSQALALEPAMKLVARSHSGDAWSAPVTSPPDKKAAAAQ
jgi:hypothetical protein